MRVIIAFALILLTLTLTAHGAPPKPRPYTGSGLLTIRPLPVREDASGLIPIYREPGIGRIAEKTPAELPLLFRIIPATAGEYPVAVMGKRGSWLKIAYDEADRGGWVEMERRWEYTPWEEFLAGCAVRLLPGVKNGYAVLRRGPSLSAAEAVPLPPDRDFRVEKIQGDWLRIFLDPQTAGWLRWRDEGGRFLVSVREAGIQQKY